MEILREEKIKNQRSKLWNFREQSDYVPEDFENIRKDSTRTSDEEFDQIIEEFESGNWAGTRTWEEYKVHEDYINFLLLQEFRKRLGERPKEEPTFTKSDVKLYYDILEIEKTATVDEIKESYRNLVKKWHPDKNKDNPIFANRMIILIYEAYEILKDHKKRKVYDDSK